jgi:hypothetical protein
MKSANIFWFAVGVGFGLTHGVWGLIGMLAILTPVAILMIFYRKWRKQKMEDEGYPDGY